MAFLDDTGLTRVWGKVDSLFFRKANIDTSASTLSNSDSKVPSSKYLKEAIADLMLADEDTNGSLSWLAGNSILAENNKSVDASSPLGLSMADATNAKAGLTWLAGTSCMDSITKSIDLNSELGGRFGAIASKQAGYDAFNSQIQACALGSTTVADYYADMINPNKLTPSLLNRIANLEMGKQPTLISGTNIKTINGNSILGSGDLVISGGGGGTISVDNVLSSNSENPVQNKVITNTLMPVVNKTSNISVGSDGSLYYQRYGGVYPISHPDLSTQPSKLPQRFGLYDMYEVMAIPVSATGANRWTLQTNIIPADAFVISAIAFGGDYTYPVRLQKNSEDVWYHLFSWDDSDQTDVTPAYVLVQYYVVGGQPYYN